MLSRDVNFVVCQFFHQHLCLTIGVSGTKEKKTRSKKHGSLFYVLLRGTYQREEERWWDVKRKINKSVKKKTTQQNIHSKTRHRRGRNLKAWKVGETKVNNRCLMSDLFTSLIVQLSSINISIILHPTLSITKDPASLSLLHVQSFEKSVTLWLCRVLLQCFKFALLFWVFVLSLCVLFKSLLKHHSWDFHFFIIIHWCVFINDTQIWQISTLY